MVHTQREIGDGQHRPARPDEIASLLSRELNLPQSTVTRVITLLDEGNTIPFLARYRKEQTGGLDEDVLRTIAQRSDYLRQLMERKAEVHRLLAELEALTPELERELSAATTLQRVEDIYRPYRPKRRTRASIAKERGLEPLADWLLSRQPFGDVRVFAKQFVAPQQGVETVDDALAGARDIIAERLADDPDNRQWVRRWTYERGLLSVRAVDATATTPYEQYYEYEEPVRSIRPHRVLAINRGEREKVLRVSIEVTVEPIIARLQQRVVQQSRTRRSPADEQLSLAIADAYTRLLAPAVERDVRNELTERAEAQAIRVFAQNVRALLLTPPVRDKVVLGLDPAYRTGCKIAVVNPTGSLLETTVVYPTPPQNEIAESEAIVLDLIERHHVDVIAIGNGTASREAEAFVAGLIPKAKRPLAYTIVNEAGASVYSASPLAREEFPHLDVTERSAVSIARRLQDPLAELVKIDPRSIGVGQYQHDVAPKELARALHDVVESAVNSVGVDVNTASRALLTYVAGLNSNVANNIVTMREETGPFPDRNALMNVPRLGPKTFEQCAGFLRITNGINPLDNTPIHPESYPIVDKLLAALGVDRHALTESDGLTKLRMSLRSLDIPSWAAKLEVGEPTLRDVIEALQRPGRDPRDELPPPILRTDVLTLDDLRPGLVLRGTVRNVVDFGAFVDIGVQQDGLVHISELSEQRVQHPLDVVRVGDIVNVRVLAIDPKRNRISLSMILNVPTETG